MSQQLSRRKLRVEERKRKRRTRKEARRLTRRSSTLPAEVTPGQVTLVQAPGRHELYFPAALARPNDPAKVVT